jgi:hypothetical protein
MKKHEKILKEHCDIREGTVDTFVDVIYAAMEQAAKQAWDESRLKIKVEPENIDEPSQYWFCKYGEFEDYLKDLKNDS